MIVKKILVAFMLMAGCGNLYAQMQQEAPQFPVDPKVRIGKLDNGLTYYIRHNEEPKGQAAFYIAHRVGSVQEDDSQQGLAHFLEHMAFNGSKHFPAGSVFSFIQRIGVTQFNAETGIDQTYYHLDNVPVTNQLVVDSCMLLLSDWSCGVELTQKEIDQERDVIHGEYRMRDNAQQRMLTRLLPQVYPGSKYADRMPIGKMEIIDNFKLDFLEAYYRKWYHPSLQSVIVVGDIDENYIEAKIKELFGPLKNPANEAPYELYPVPDNAQPIYAIDKDKEQRMSTLNLHFKRPIVPYDQRNVIYYAQKLISSITCMIMDERMQEMALQPDCPFSVAQFSDGQYLVSKTCNAFNLTVVPKPGMSVEATQAAMTELARARQHGFGLGEMQRAMDKLQASVQAQYDNREKQPNRYYAQQYLQNFLESEPIPAIDVELQMMTQLLQQITPEVLQQCLQQFTPSVQQNFVLMGMCPDNEQESAPTAQQLKQAVEAGFGAQTTPYVDNTKSGPLIAELPTPVPVQGQQDAPFGFQKWTMSNGAAVYFKQTDFKDDQISMRAISKGGFNALDDSNANLSAIMKLPTGLQLNLFELIASENGLAGFTSSDLKKKLAGNNVGLEMSMNDEHEILHGSSTLRDLSVFFELLYLGFQGPGNDPKSFNAISQQLQMVLPQLDGMHNTIQADSLLNTTYNHHPRYQLMHTSTLQQVDYERVRQVMADRFHSAGDFDFIFSGPFNVDTLRALVEQYIAPLKGVDKREAYTDLHISPVRGYVSNTYPCTMENTDAAESIINVRWIYNGNFGIKDALVARALGSILGDRYFQKIREEGSMGYSAGAEASVKMTLAPHIVLNASANVKPDKKNEALDIIYKEIEQIASKGVSPDEISKFLEPALTAFAENQRSDAYWIDIMEMMLTKGFDYCTNYESTLRSITSKDIQNFAKKKLLKAKNRITVVMVPAE